MRPNLSFSKTDIVRTALLASIFAALNCSYSLAQNVPSPAEREAIEQDIQAKQRIENERQNLIRQKETQELENIKKTRSPQTQSPVKEEEFDDQTCRTIKKLQITGNQEVASWILNRKFVNPLLAKKSVKSEGDVNSPSTESCLTKADLATLRDQIENYYLKHGYVLARVYFDTSKLAAAQITIVIEEGKLEKLKLKDNSKLNDHLPFRRTLQKLGAFPFLFEGKGSGNDDVINLRDIEQGLDQINRLSSQSAKMEMTAGSKPGYSNIEIANQIGHLTTASIGADNSGNQSTGRQKRKLSLNQDNLLGLNDNIYLNYSQSNATPLFGMSSGLYDSIGGVDNSKTRFSKAFYASISVPFGYWTAGASYSYSKYLLTTAGSVTTMQTSGNSEAKSYYLERVLSRGQRYKISLKTELDLSDTNSYLEDVYVPVSSRRLTEGNLYLNNTFYFPNGSLFIQPKYTRGLTLLGAMKDQKGLGDDKPHAQFTNYGLYAQSNFNFNLPLPNLNLVGLRATSKTVDNETANKGGAAVGIAGGAGGTGSAVSAREAALDATQAAVTTTNNPPNSLPLNYKLTFDSLLSNDTLYGSDQFAIGGRYTVRGFQESIISGDNGYLVRNDLSTRVSDLLPNSFTKFLGVASLNTASQGTDPKNSSFLSNFSPRAILNNLRLGIFYDYGAVRNHVVSGPRDKGYMSGAGMALSYFGKFFNWDLTYSKGLHSPQFLRDIDGIPKDNETIYFSVTASLGLF